MNTRPPSSPSLFQPESRGGDIAEGGHSFQEQYVLARIPHWLALGGFDSMIREAMGDTEAKFFVPGHGYQIELIEVKDHNLTPSEFWNEIARFQELERGSPNVYRWFTLASAGLSSSLEPLANGLRRIRAPYGFYEDGSAIKVNSYQDYIDVVTKLGKTTQDAQFLFEKVLIDHDWGLAKNHGEGLFIQSFLENLPKFKDLPGSSVKSVYVRISTLIRKLRNQPITRLNIESEIEAAIPSHHLPAVTPVELHTVSSDSDGTVPQSLEFDLTSYWGGPERNYPPKEEWEQLIHSFDQTRKWIIQNRGHRQILLTGSRRLSTIIAFGNVFSSVAGFSITQNHRGQLWETSKHSVADAHSYDLKAVNADGDSNELVACISIGNRDTTNDMKSALQELNLDNYQQIYITGSDAVLTSEQANRIVFEIKKIIATSMSQNKTQRLHLFYSGPSPVALFLGHRLNAIGPVQCYEWASGGRYVPTYYFLT